MFNIAALFFCIFTSQLIASCNQAPVSHFALNFRNTGRMISEYHNSAGVLFSGHNRSQNGYANHSAGILFSDNNHSPFDLTTLHLPVLAPSELEAEEIHSEDIQRDQQVLVGPHFNPSRIIRDSLELLIKESCSTMYKAFTDISIDSNSIPLDKYKKAYSFISNQLKTYGFTSSSFSIRSTDKPSYNWGTALSTILIPEVDLNLIENDTISPDTRNEYKFLIAHQANHMSKNIERACQQVFINVARKQSSTTSKQVIDAVISRVAGEQYVRTDAQLSFKQILIKSLLIDKGKQLATASVIKPIDKIASDKLKYTVAKYECRADVAITDRDTILGGISLLKKLGKSIAASTSLESCDKCLSDLSGDRLHALEFKLNQRSNSWIAEFEKTKQESANDSKLIARL